MPEYYIGLMSGTSMDGIDAVLVDFSTQSPRLVTALCQPWPAPLRDQVFATRELADEALADCSELDRALGEQFALACNQVLAEAGIAAGDIIAIGSHGQTLRHRTRVAHPFSLQIGNAGVIATRTGIDVVSDFRTADIEAGGEGAPLAPAFHRAVFHDDNENRCVLNLGGIANITVLPAGRGSTVIGFDTGPGNGLMDAWTAQVLQQPFDRDGQWAAQGEVDTAVLKALLAEPYFRKPPPKSTGFETFNLNWLKAQDIERLSDNNVQTTLAELSAVTIADAILRYAPNTQTCLVCGGGIHNRYLMQRLGALLAPVTLASTETCGVHPDWVEAMAFAWLARQHVRQRPANLPSVTGAREAVILGKLSKAA